MKKLLLTMISCLLSGILSMTVCAQSRRSVGGTVYGDDGLPIPGVAVMIAGTTTGTITDADGKFTIMAANDDVLTFSALGFEDVRETVERRKQLNIVLRTKQNQLDDAVVIGYGTQKKSDLTGSVAVVKMDDMDSPTITSVDQALQGRVAGVDVMSAGGEPGEGTSIRIRGTRSISAGNDPLIVVDGVMDAVEYFSDINPGDIKSVTVLKDASSTAIYGARGSNGVILVTTKGDSVSKLNVDFQASAGIAHLPRKLDIMNATEFEQYRNDYKYMAGNASATVPLSSSYYAFENPAAAGEGTSWQDELTRLAVNQVYRLSLSQGDALQHTYISIGYDNNQGIIKGSDMQRFSALLKLDRTLFKGFRLGARVQYTHRHNNLNKITVNGINTTAAVCLSPIVRTSDIWNRYSDQGTGGGSVFNNPYISALNETNYKNTNYFSLSPWIRYTPVKGVTLFSSFSYYMNNVESFFYSPASMPLATYRKTGGTARRENNNKTNMLSETTISWVKDFNKKHKVNIMAGFTAQKTGVDTRYVSGTGYLDDNVGPNNLAGIVDKRNLVERSSMSQIRRMSVLGRANYSYRSRYFVTLTARYDGSSNFAAGHKWAFFPAAAFKWSLINEQWMQQVKGAGVNDLSLRLSAGRSGNDAIPAYVSQQVMSTEHSQWLFGQSQQVSTYPSRLDNPDLTWEKTDSYNAGLDVALLNNRITMTLDAYLSYTSDLLMQVPNALQSGYATVYSNVGDTKGYGVEFSINSNNISTRHFHWLTSFSISHNNSYVTDLGTDYQWVATYSKSTQMMFGFRKGYSANALWGYQYCGVWHNDAEREENRHTREFVSYEDRNGFGKYADVNHDGVLDSNDMVFLGSSDPVLFGGLQNTFKYKGLELGIYLTYSIGGKIYNISELLLGTSNTAANKYRYMMDGWHPVRNPESDIPSAYSNDGYASSRFVHDASFLRLKTLSVSYTFDLSHKVKWLKDISLGLYADNLALLSAYNGFDPDVTSSKAVRRLDNASYPNPRSYTFSLKIRY